MRSELEVEQILSILDKVDEISEEEHKNSIPMCNAYLSIRFRWEIFKKKHLQSFDYNNKIDNFSIYIDASKKHIVINFANGKDEIRSIYKWPFFKYNDPVYRKYKEISHKIYESQEIRKKKDKEIDDKNAVKRFNILYEKTFIDIDMLILGDNEDDIDG